MSASPGEAGSPRTPHDRGLSLTASRGFVSWLEASDVSLAFTTYQAGKVFLVGRDDAGRLSIFERTFERCMGLAAGGDSLFMSSAYQLWRFENSLGPGAVHDGYDRVYVPQVAWTTGDVDVHDIGIGADGRPIFVSTLFSCLATVSETHSFEPQWRPPFISRLAPEDRCHLNGLAMHEGRPRFVTATSRSDVADGWRDDRVAGGCVVDVPSSEIVATGLSMPHSPRLYRGRLWLHDSGTGRFGHVEPDTGRFEEVAFCPGYLRGLAFAGDWAVAGLSLPRGDSSFAGLPLEAALAARGARPRCALQVIDLRTGECPHVLRIEGLVEELYDVIVLPGVARPMAIGVRGDEIRRVLRLPD